jgi:hypothetical protein
MDTLHLFDRGQGFDHDLPVFFVDEYLPWRFDAEPFPQFFGIVACPFLDTRITISPSVLLGISVLLVELVRLNIIWQTRSTSSYAWCELRMIRSHGTTATNPGVQTGSVPGERGRPRQRLRSGSPLG